MWEAAQAAATIPDLAHYLENRLVRYPRCGLDDVHSAQHQRHFRLVDQLYVIGLVRPYEVVARRRT